MVLKVFSFFLSDQQLESELESERNNIIPEGKIKGEN